MAKKKASSKKAVKLQSFKLYPHGYPKDKVILYVVMAAIIGFGVGWLFRDQFTSVLGASNF